MKKSELLECFPKIRPERKPDMCNLHQKDCQDPWSIKIKFTIGMICVSEFFETVSTSLSFKEKNKENNLPFQKTLRQKMPDHIEISESRNERIYNFHPSLCLSHQNRNKHV
jgi:hypothetical protein